MPKIQVPVTLYITVNLQCDVETADEATQKTLIAEAVEDLTTLVSRGAFKWSAELADPDTATVDDWEVDKESAEYIV